MLAFRANVSSPNEPVADIEAVLSHRHDNGADFWATPDSRLGTGDPFSTVTALVILHELGLTGDHEAVAGALRLVLDARRPDGRIRVAPRGTMYPCHTAVLARALGRYGLASDPRISPTIAYLLENRHTDGGWRCLKFSGGRGPETELSNPGVTLFALDFFRFTEHRESNLLDRAVESLLDHWNVRKPIGPCHFGIGSLFMQVEYPFLRYNLFYYVYVLSFFPRAVDDPRFLEAFDVLESKLDEQGRIVVERPNRRLAQLELCRKGQPSDRATRRWQEIRTRLAGQRDP